MKKIKEFIKFIWGVIRKWMIKKNIIYRYYFVLTIIKTYFLLLRIVIKGYYCKFLKFINYFLIFVKIYFLGFSIVIEAYILKFSKFIEDSYDKIEEIIEHLNCKVIAIKKIFKDWIDKFFK